MNKRLLLSVLCAGCLSCKDKVTMVRPPPPDPVCGDSLLNPSVGEECEGSDFGGATCQSLGYDTGTLSCGADCKLVKTLCSKRCGNGMLDPGETCDGTLGLSACATWGYVACSASCQLDRSHCITTPFATAPALQLSYGGAATVGDLPPTGFGDLVMVVPARSRVETWPWTVEQGFNASAGRTLSFGGAPTSAMPADLDGDGQLDIGVIDADGTVSRYRYNGSGFTPEPYPAAGASAVAFLGSGHFAPDAGLSLYAATDGGALLVTTVGALTHPSLVLTPGVTAVTAGDATRDGLDDLLWCPGTASVVIAAAPRFVSDGGIALPFTPTLLAAADFDGDGDLDLAAFDGAAIKLLENIGGAFADRGSFATTIAGSLRAVDLDLDGRVDLVWETTAGAEIRRNEGGFVFSPWQVTFGPGASLGLAVGDVDGDGDLDLASTRSDGGDATVTWVQTNRVR